MSEEGLPVSLADASDLAAVVERARALLDEGDVIAARLLAAGAYDQAKAAAAYGERFGAAERLVAKARRLQGDALLIEARAKIRLADEWDGAQAAGKAAKKGRPKNVPDENIFTQEEAGLSAKEIHEARKLRDAERGAPGIVERAIAARLAAALEPSRASLRHAIGTRSATKEERGNNLYETPREGMATLLALEDFGPLVWDPACGKGASARPMEDAGHEVIISDLVDYGTVTKDGECQHVADFLATRRTAMDDGIVGIGGKGRPDIVTNPPYGEVLNAFVAHALRVHKPRKMALLLNLNFICGTDDDNRNFALDQNPPARIIVFARRLPMMHRDGYEGKKSTSQMNTAWFIWEQDEDGQYRGAMQARRVDWKDFEPGAQSASEAPVALSKGEKAGELPEAAGPRQRKPGKAGGKYPSPGSSSLSPAAQGDEPSSPTRGEETASPATSSRPDEEPEAATSPAASVMAGAELPPSVPASIDETSPGGELCPGQEAGAVPKSAASADPTYPADLVPGRTATEISVGGMKKGSFARITFHRNDDGSFAIGMEYELKGFCGGASPKTGAIAGFDDALLLALSEMERRLGEVEGDQSSECRDHHRAAARAGREWCAERRREWGLS